MGAYGTVVIQKLLPMPPMVLLIASGGIVAGLVGLVMGYLTLRLRGAFFAIATLALAVVLQTIITNWGFVGGSRGAYVVRPPQAPVLETYVQYLFFVMLVLSVLSLITARAIERSRLGYGFATIRDDELAAESSGVPTLKLKLIATTLSGAMMGMAGAPFPYYINYLDPASGFNLAFAINAIAMPVIGGTTSWLGPLIGAVLLGSVQQYATVAISSVAEFSNLIVGALLVLFVVVAPHGIIGMFRRTARKPGH
jgi:branched-chain amino acid transport system permease protein